MKTKKCGKCKEMKLISEFHKAKRCKDGYKYQCKNCCDFYRRKYYENNREKVNKRKREDRKNYLKYYKEYAKDYYKKNIEKYNTKARLWRKNNPEKVRERQKKYRENNREKIRERFKEWADKNPEKMKLTAKRNKIKRYSIPKNRLNDNISRAINHSLKGNKNGKHWEDLVDFNLRNFKKHMQKLFKTGMSWDNYGKIGWEIDHIKPQKLFNFNSYEDPEFKECWRLKNLQPLWADENLIKGAKYER